MDKRLQQLVEHLTEKFGLEHYQLGRHSFYKEYMYNGEVHYKCNLEFFPLATINELDEDFNPPGTAVIEYNLTTKKLLQLLFVHGQSFSTKKVFHTQSVREVAKWIEQETGYRYESDFTAVDTLDNGYRFEAEIDGLPSSPSGRIEVEFDAEGKLTSFFMSDMHIMNGTVKQETFTLAVESIGAIVQKQTKLIHSLEEDEENIIPYYAIDEVYITNDGQRLIPYDERDKIIVNQPLIWTTALTGTIERQIVEPYCDVSAEEAFNRSDVEMKPVVTEKQLASITPIITDVLRMVLPNDSNKWTLKTVRRAEQFIEVVCTWNAIERTYFNRKFVVLLDPVSLEVLTYVDNSGLLEMIDSFTPAPDAKLSREEAYQLLAPFVTLTPTYVYDVEAKQFELCGLLHATHAVEAVTGDITSLNEL